MLVVGRTEYGPARTRLLLRSRLLTLLSRGGGIPFTMIVNMIFTLRIYALYNRNRKGSRQLLNISWLI